LHVSELDWKRIDRVEDVLKEGEIVKFKVVGRDPKTGKIKLSRRALMPKPEGYVEREERPRERGDRDRDRGPRDRDRGPRMERPSRVED
jgi:polyribonucleotide nucleotidyltransferase